MAASISTRYDVGVSRNRGDGAPAQSLQSLQIIWVAMLVSVFVYALVAWLFASTVAPMDPVAGTGVGHPLILALHAAGLAILVMAFLLPRILLRQPAPDDLRPVTAAAPSAFSVKSRVARALTVRWAMAEAVGVLGLVSAFLVGQWEWFIPLGGLSVAALLFAYPTEAAVRTLDEIHRSS